MPYSIRRAAWWAGTQPLSPARCVYATARRLQSHRRVGYLTYLRPYVFLIFVKKAWLQKYYLVNKSCSFYFEPLISQFAGIQNLKLKQMKIVKAIKASLFATVITTLVSCEKSPVSKENLPLDSVISSVEFQAVLKASEGLAESLQSSPEIAKGLSEKSVQFRLQTSLSVDQQATILRELGASSQLVNAFTSYCDAAAKFRSAYPYASNLDRNEVKRRVSLASRNTASEEFGGNGIVAYGQAMSACRRQYENEKMECKLVFAAEAGLGVLTIFGRPVAMGAAALAITVQLTTCLSEAASDYYWCEHPMTT